jgi:predicted O-linked N-acetylglucosamine transferase (SPINDLY family)
VFLAYAAPSDAPAVEPAPCTRGAPVTFGSFNAIHKLSDAVLSVWAAVLRALPQARLLLKTAEFGDPQVAARYRQKLAALGVAPERVELLGFQKELASHLELYHRVDIALDTFPYHGTTTTCEALYMGVPVVTLAGETHASRVGVSLLHAVGLDHLVANSPEAFVDICTGLAARVDELAVLRQTLRQRMSASPLMDAADLARAVEAAYRQAWREACQR